MAKKCQYKDCERGTYKEFCLLHQPKKVIKKRGKQDRIWQLARNQWIDEHGTNHKCYICGKQLSRFTLTIDHVIPRSNAKNYANRHSDENLRPCCMNCNLNKGSKH